MNLRQGYTQRGVAGILLAAVLAWLIFFTSYVPGLSPKRTSAELAKLRDELQAVAGEVQRAKAIAESIPRLQAELEQMVTRWEALRSLLPKASEMSDLLAKVTTAGMDAGVQFTLFEPQAPQPADLYTRYPIKVTVTGGYHQVGNFFDNLCNMDRLVGISDVKLAQYDKGMTGTTVEATATISAYTYNEQGSVAAQQGKQTTEKKTTQKTGRQPTGK
jgi:type IV pilus assembly protein PilO